MARRVFYSFDYEADAARVQLVRNMGVLEAQPLLKGNKWEEVRRGGDAAIKRWIDRQMEGKSCLVVLVGAETASRRWVQYEIQRAWRQGLGLVGIRIHGLKDLKGRTSSRGPNPFRQFEVHGDRMSEFVRLYEPWAGTSKEIYAAISDKIEDLVEEAIAARDVLDGD